MMRKGNRGKGGRGKRIPDKVMSESLQGLRLVCLESNGVNADDGSPKMEIEAKKTTLRMLAHDGRADHLIRERQRNWLIMVVGIAQDDRGDIYTKHEFVFGRGKRIGDEELREEVQGKLDRVRGQFNEKHLIDWGWIGEILPLREHERVRMSEEELDEFYQDRAEERLLKLIEERHANWGEEYVSR